MKVQDKIEAMLMEHGLWPQEARAVIEELKAAWEAEAMKGHWEDDAEQYPAPLFTVLWVRARRHALGWIDANKPGHFARGAFH